MIEHVIAERLLNDAKIKEYCGNKVFAVYAPDGTKCPYMTITESDTRLEDDVIATFDVIVEVYDYDKDKRKVRAVSQRIKDLLNCEMFEDNEGLYSSIRVWYTGREHIKESESTLSRMYVTFSARACEEVTES